MAIFYTVHGADEHPAWDDGTKTGSVADDFGFDRRLGFRPRWCSGIYEDSLAESWFSIWVASPLFVELISFIESDDAIPIDALAWTQIRQRYMGLPDGEPGWLDEFECIFDVEGVPRWRLEYLVPDSPGHIKSIPAAMFTHALETQGAHNISKLYQLDEDQTAQVRENFTHIVEAAHSMANRAGLNWPLGLENGYRCIVQTSGIPALLWSIGTRKPFDPCLLDMSADDLGDRPGCAYDLAQQCRQRWDEDPNSFTSEDFNELYRLFKMAISDAAEKTALRMMSGVERNERCPCGSGKKFKKCHGTRHDIDWYGGERLL